MMGNRTFLQQVQRVYVTLEDHARQALRPVGLSPTQFNLLELLASAPREGLAISTIAERLLCSRGNASRLVARMADAGLVTTGGLSSDERLVLVQLSRPGRKLHARGVEALAAMTAHDTSSLDGDERELLTTLLGRVADDLATNRTDPDDW